MSITGFPDREPVRTGIPISDSVAGIYAAFGILAAVVAREKTGRGQEIQTSLVDAMVSILSYLSAEYFALGQDPPGDSAMITRFSALTGRSRRPTDTSTSPLRENTCGRGWLSLWVLMDLTRDPRFQTNALRLQNRQELNRRVTEITSRNHGRMDRILKQRRCALRTHQQLAQALEDPQIRHQKMVLKWNSPPAGCASWDSP